MKLDREQWHRLSALLDTALEMAASERETWLQNLPNDHSSLQEPLRTLLAQRARIETGDFLKKPDFAAALRVETKRSQISSTELQSGSEVGAYRLLRELGRGGMGSVWLGERIDRKLKRQVALKFPYAGPNQRQLAERLVRERDILASLEHPNIARLYDADVTALGQPFLVLEYVDGIPINDYCDQHRLTIRERLVLFLQVLNAVQYAHTHLVIHRDLKPSNILVTNDGVAQLLDFGIAKLISDGAAPESAVTQFGGRALTPDYASPEQINGESITTACDVYSLGVVLYELLTGSRPYKLKRDSQASLEAAIAEANVVAPSRIPFAAQVVENRSANIKSIFRALHGDLGTILLKSLRKSPTERYLTVDALANDIGCYLDHKPVSAQPDSRWYRTRRFLGRHRVASLFSGILVLTLALGAILLAMQTRVATQQAQVAKREAAKAKAVQKFLLDIFEANSDQQPDPIKAQHTTARELLDIGTSRVSSALKDSPDSQQEVMATLSDMYYQLGLDEESAKIARERIPLLKQAYGAQDPSVVEALIAYAGALHSTSQRQLILPALTEAKDILDARHDYSSALRGHLLVRLAQRHQNISYKQMLHYADEAVVVLRPLSTIEGTELASALHLAARARALLGDFEHAVPLYRESLKQSANRVAPSVVETTQTLVYLAEAQMGALDIAGAEQSFRKAYELSMNRIGISHDATIQSTARLGAFLHATSRRIEGRELLTTALRHALETKGEADTLLTPGVRAYCARARLAEGRIEDALTLNSKVLDSNRINYPASAVLSANLRDQSAIYAALGRDQQAAKLLEESYAMWQAATGAGIDPAQNNRFIFQQARLQLSQGKSQDALQTLLKLAAPIATRDTNLDDSIMLILQAQANLQMNKIIDAEHAARQAVTAIQESALRKYYQSIEAEALLRLGEAQRYGHNALAARTTLEQALELRVSNDDAASPWLAEVQVALAETLIDLNEPSRARELLVKARSIHAQHAELATEFRTQLRALERRLDVGN